MLNNQGCLLGERPKLPTLNWHVCQESTLCLGRENFKSWLKYSKHSIEWMKHAERFCKIEEN